MFFKKKAFTLLELMIAVVLVSILVYMAVQNLGGNIRNARKTKVLSDLAELKKAFGLYAMKKGKYPTELKQLVTDHVIRKLPKDPWGYDYSIVTKIINGQKVIFLGSYYKGTIEVKIGVKE